MTTKGLAPIRGLTWLVVWGEPLPTLRPQVTFGKPWLYFRIAWWRFSVALVPLDLENVMANYATLQHPED